MHQFLPLENGNKIVPTSKSKFTKCLVVNAFLLLFQKIYYSQNGIKLDFYFMLYQKTIIRLIYLKLTKTKNLQQRVQSFCYTKISPRNLLKAQLL